MSSVTLLWVLTQCLKKKHINGYGEFSTFLLVFPESSDLVFIDLKTVMVHIAL